MAPQAEADGSALRLPVPDPGEGTFVVSWRAVSALDGHQPPGEFAFAVGDAGAIASAPPETAVEGGSVELSIVRPPVPDERRSLDAVIAVMRDVDCLTLTETVRSGPGAEGTTTMAMTGAEFMDYELYARGTVELIRLPGEPPGLRLYLPGSRILIEFRLDDRMTSPALSRTTGLHRRVARWTSGGPRFVVVATASYPSARA